MESSELLWQINSNLEEISAKLDILISLYELGQKQDIDKYKEKILGRSQVKRDIYDLCDGSLTVREIAKKLNKSMPHVSKLLSELEDGKIIRAKLIGRKKYCIRVV